MLSYGDRIVCLPATDSPLSSDVCALRGDTHTWLYDVGASAEALAFIRTLDAPCAVLSHFHQDHTANAALLPDVPLYVSRATLRHTMRGTVVDAPMPLDEGLVILPIPSTHAKGSLALLVDDAYLLVGDALYPMERQGQAVYNATLLKDLLDFLRACPAPSLLVSHRRPFVQSRAEVVDRLSAVYGRRSRDNPWIMAEG